ncbi:MAG: hypothetical protein M1837_005209 [Sclerophora amabilis]|nr:MAG: hypothetical protein M1837_005209 [Sclerophora amabilis]
MSTALPPRQATDESSSPELSSPPKSESDSPPSPTTTPAGRKGEGDDVAAKSHPATVHVKSAGVAKNHHDPSPTTSAKNIPTASAKKSARKKDTTSNSKNHNNHADPKPAKTKTKTTKPRNPSATTTTATAGAPKPRKRSKNTDAATGEVVKGSSTSRQSKITNLVGSERREAASGSTKSSAPTAPARNGNNEAISPSLSTVPAPRQSTPPRSRGQNYDPIRSANMDITALTNPVNALPVSPTPPRSANRASASPSISSLIDPPASHPPSFPQALKLQTNGDTTSSVSSPSTIQVAQPFVPAGPSPTVIKADDNDDDDNGRACTPSQPPAPQAAPKKLPAGTSTGTSSAAPSPKPARPKEAAPAPLPPGNGLLSSALFGGPTSAPADDAKEVRAPTIVLHVALKGESNTVVNFARLAEEQYGFNALHPRIASQRERMARVAAAGAALERLTGPGSADEMSLDLSEPEKDVDMGGVDASADGGEKKKKRKMKSDDYDKDDPFVDDSEMLWEEQAAASKDGFFVYSGPLVPAGEKPVIERADGSTAKRGRGRGRGGATRGSGAGRGGGASGSGSTARGTAPIRKPRITKADRAKMEQEKQERENMMLLPAKPSSYVG